MESLFLLILAMLAVESADSIRSLYKHFLSKVTEKSLNAFNLINISYCEMKILPYEDETFSPYKDSSVQEFRFALSQQINKQVIFATFVENVETKIKSNAFIKALKSVLLSFGYHG